MTSGARVIVGGSAQVATRIMGIAAAAVTVPLLARHLEADGYGRFTIVMNIAYLAIVVAELGLPLLAGREWPSVTAEERHRWLNDFWVLRWTSVLVIVGATVAATAVAPVGAKAELILAFAIVPIVLIHNAINALFTAELDPWPVVRGEVANRLLWVVLAVAAVAAGASLAMVLGTLVVVHAAALAVTATSAFKRGLIKLPGPRFDPGSKALLRAAAPLALIPLLGAVYARSDALILAIHVPQAEVGVYGAIWRVAEAALAVVVVASAFLLPRMSHAGTEEQRRSDYTRTLRLMMTIYLPGAVFIALLSQPILRVIGGDQFAQQIAVGGGSVSPAVALAIMSVVIVLMAVGITNGAAMIACRRQRALLRQLVLVLAVNVPLVWVLGARWSVVGVAIAALLSEVVAVVHASFVIRRELGHISARRILAWPLGIAAGAAAAMVATSTAPPIVSLGAGLAVAVGLGWLSPARRDVTEVLSRGVAERAPAVAP